MTHNHQIEINFCDLYNFKTTEHSHYLLFFFFEIETRVQFHYYTENEWFFYFYIFTVGLMITQVWQYVTPYKVWAGPF